MHIQLRRQLIYIKEFRNYSPLNRLNRNYTLKSVKSFSLSVFLTNSLTRINTLGLKNLKTSTDNIRTYLKGRYKKVNMYIMSVTDVSYLFYSQIKPIVLIKITFTSLKIARSNNSF